ncbi:MAG: hypothetical protein AAF597_21280, partial [Bacteroidota bacterium]
AYALFRFRPSIGWGMLLVVTGSLGLNAQDQPSPVFPEDRHQELVEELDFTPPAEEKPEPEASTDSENWFDWDWEPWQIDFSSGTTWIIFLALLGLLGFIIYRILGDVSLRKRTRGEAEEQDEINIEDIEEEQLVAQGVSLSLLERAERAQQFDVAVRLLYIQSLKELQDAGLIKYRKDFSNRDYQNQLRGSDVLEDFQTVTYAYERYWFGKYPIDRLSYRNTYQRFQALNERIRAKAPQADAYA